MVFRRDNKVDAFQRQMSALRQQLGNADEEGAVDLDNTAGQPGGEPQAGQFADPDDEPAGEYSRADAGGYSFGDFSAAAQTGGVDQGVMPMAPEIPELPVVDSQVSVIAHDTVWKGDLQSDGSIHVHGRVEGTLRATHDIYIAEEADVDAQITAAKVVVAGLVRGMIRCGDRFEVLPPGRVASDVEAPTLVVHEGATVTGQFRMGPGESGAEPNQAPVVQRRAARTGA